MNKKLLLKISFLVLFTFYSFTNLMAQGDSTYDWVGNNSNFYDASNWTSTNGAVQFDNNGFKVVRVFDVGVSPQINSFVDWQPGIFDTYDNVELTVNADFNVFFNDWLNGTITVNDGATFTCRNIFRIGREGSGVVNINGGVFRSSDPANFQSIFIGVLQGGDGTVNVNNDGLLESGQQIEVGTRDFYPLGELNVNSGGVATATTVTAIGPNGTINVNGGVLNTGNVLIVGDLFVDNAGNEGALNDTPNVGDLNINAGTVVFNQNNLEAPAFIVHPDGQILIDEGSLILNNPGFDYTDEISTLVTNGQLVAAEGKTIEVSYNGTNQTTVTASPTASTTDFNANTYFTIYPNPSRGIINLTPKDASLGELSVAIFDLTGKKVFEVNEKNSTQTITMQTDGKLVAGMYLVKIQSSKGELFSKVIIQ